jgi:superfamily II RNA helicase
VTRNRKHRHPQAPPTAAGPGTRTAQPARVTELLGLIGTPPELPFAPDPFQLLAAELVASHDTIVSAPTGSGKTWIAKTALARELAAGARAWYASPLKALSNSKFLEFGRDFGQDCVGLLTGDHKINTQAPIIVGTTEILRNQLYDALAGLCDVECDLVVLDEAHYLGDPERGVVWEEVLIYMPRRIRFLLLSATIDNAQDLADWLGHNRQREVKVVQGGERPVPLEPLALDFDSLTTLAQYRPPSRKSRGRGSRRGVGGFLNRHPEGGLSSHYPREAKGNPEGSLDFLRGYNLLPAIFFLKSRRECDLAARNAVSGGSFDGWDKRRARGEFIDSYVADCPALLDYQPVDQVRQKGVAAHHAGHLPQFKMLVEELMTRNLISAIFATSTVAAGVNFPARSVVIPQSDRFNGQEFSDLTATDLWQMTGRAGRRGLDNIGFAIIVPGPYMDMRLMQGLFNSPPDPVLSSLRVNFAMVLNLLNAYEPREVKDLLAKSLAAWQMVKRPTKGNLASASRDMWEDFKRHQAFLKTVRLVDHLGHLTADGLTATGLRLEHPLVMHAAIKEGGLPEDPVFLSAVLASLTEEKRPQKPRYGHAANRSQIPGFLRAHLLRLERAVGPMIRLLESHSFDVPGPLSTRATRAVHCWASGGSFSHAASILERDPGDLVRLILLVGEQLHQLSGLKNLGPITEAAQKAKDLIYREPVV